MWGGVRTASEDVGGAADRGVADRRAADEARERAEEAEAVAETATEAGRLAASAGSSGGGAVERESRPAGCGRERA